MRIRILALAPLFLLALPQLALASGPTSPVVVTDPDDSDGNIFSPGVRLVEDLPQDYVEEEFLIEGAATLYNYDSDPPVRDELVAIQDDVPYKTRIIVRRPAVHGPFKGTVVIEWWNSTAGFDTAPVWDASAEYYARAGWIYVGITNSSTAIDFLTGGCSLFGVIPPTCGTRYEDLSMPENGLAYEIVDQITNMLRNGPNSVLPDMFDVARVFQSGQSQQGGSMVTYTTAFHSDLNDGYFVQAASSARPINFGPVCGATGSDPYPDCTPRLTGDDRRVRTDLPVPVYRAMTETDVDGVLAFGTRQEDTDNFRYYEMAGTAHVTVHKDVEIFPGFLLAFACLFPLNTLADGPVFGSYLYNAMWNNMEATDIHGTDPPHGDLIEDDDGVIARDEFGNALGGIRLPMMEVPIASYGNHNVVDPSLPAFLQPLLNLFCRLAGTTMPFDDETLDELYPNLGIYVSQTVHASNALSMQGFLLPKDRNQIVVTAAVSGIGCGIGFELAFLLPPLMWLRQRRRSRA